MYNRDFVKYFRLNKFYLHVCGVLPFSSCGFIVNGIFIITPICSLFLTLPGFYFMISQLKTMSAMEALDMFCELLEMFTVAFKVVRNVTLPERTNRILLIRYIDRGESIKHRSQRLHFLKINFRIIVMLLLPKRSKLVNLVELCNELWESIEDKEETETVMGYATTSLYLTYGYSVNIFAALFSLLAQPLFTEFVYDSNGTMIVSKDLPYPFGIFQQNVKLYNILYALQIPAGLIGATALIGIDTAVAFFVFHSCAHFKLLQFRMSKLKEINNGDDLDTNSKRAFEKIVEIVEQHKRVLNYSEAMEDIFCPVVLMQTILSITIICGYGFNFLMVDEGQNIAMYGILLVGAIFQLLIFCWPPDKLHLESTNIGLNAYDSPWYTWTKRERKLIEVILFRSQRVAYLSAGKFAHMSLQAFSSILSSAFSFFTLLRRVV